MVIAIASQKGGVGKTSTSISLAAGLAHRGKKILLIDVDSQANSSKVLLRDYPKIDREDTLYQTIIHRQPLVIHESTVPNLHVVPAHILLSNTDIELTPAMDHRELRLKSELKKVEQEYDHVIIDCPPALSWLTINAFTAAEGVIVVVAPGYFELDSIVQISKTIQQVQEHFNQGLQLLGFLFTMSDSTINSRTSLLTLRHVHGDKLFDTIIPRNVDIKDAHFNKQDIFSFNPKAPAAKAYEQLIDELEL
jgi:chromosome partitioning protein